MILLVGYSLCWFEWFGLLEYDVLVMSFEIGFGVLVFGMIFGLWLVFVFEGCDWCGFGVVVDVFVMVLNGVLSVVFGFVVLIVYYWKLFDLFSLVVIVVLV